MQLEGMHTINSDPNIAKLQQYTIEIYPEIQDLSEQENMIVKQLTTKGVVDRINGRFYPSFR